jgi:3alpha(or 20beta)-hydroxysteroid dehydrogenase
VGLLDGKVAIITGAGSERGQGAAEARLFVEEGAAAVILADLPSSQGEAVAASIGERARFVALDVTDPLAWALSVREVHQDQGRLDVLVNNAGVWLAKRLVDTTPEEWRHVVEVNQTGVFLGMAAVAPIMCAARSGSIVNISSNAGLRGGGMPLAYAASKWAVRGMSRAAASELAPFGVRVNVVCPGFVDTPMIEGGPEELARLAELAPFGRVASPLEVARVVAYLASGSASYVSGAEVAVDGAFSA